MTQIGIDTSLLIGLLDRKDVWHGPAMALQQAFKVRDVDVAVFDCVLGEAISTLARRIHEQRRSADLEQLLGQIADDYPEEDILWVSPDIPALYAEIVELVRSSQGELNFNDALIALSCRYRNIPFLTSFDRDFDKVTWLTRVTQPGDLP